MAVNVFFGPNRYICFNLNLYTSIMNINILQAYNGDAIHINFLNLNDQPRNILIDGGPSPAYSKKNGKGKVAYGDLYYLIENLKNKDQVIDLLILTHIDDDHIDGLLSWLKVDSDAKSMIKCVWFNSGKLIAEYLESPENKELEITFSFDDSFETSVTQGINFEKFILENDSYQREIILAGRKSTFESIQFQFLSPSKEKLADLLKLWKKEAPNYETSGGRGNYSKSIKQHIEEDKFDPDTRCANGSSIAFILNHNEKKFVFLGDSHPNVVVDELKRLKFTETDPLIAEFIKVSHHGSAGNTSPEIIKLIKTDNYILSTDGQQHGHPDKVLIARIISENPKAIIGFNYPDLIDTIFLKQDFEDFPHIKAVDAKNILKKYV